ncbi:hypothetical protein F383_11803 [Gossypium arboreum]|uniref:Uncharacterized protein n=1 Tax=Gossypium arboreum TaxID=29729 RepID=A0A0B0PWI7_GOSAR|nr:hypothetical protein F383_11803 [Gossypium arboreum]
MRWISHVCITKYRLLRVPD